MDLSRLKADVVWYAGVGASAFALAAIWFVAVWRFGVSEDFIPLHYTVYFGLDRFGPKYDLFLFPSLGSVILAVNALLARTVFAENRLWQGVFLGLTFMMELTLLVSLVLAVLKGLS